MNNYINYKILSAIPKFFFQILNLKIYLIYLIKIKKPINKIKIYFIYKMS